MATHNLGRIILSKVQTTITKQNNLERNVNSVMLLNTRGDQVATGDFEYIKVSKAGVKKNVGIITLDRPKVLNALSEGLGKDLYKAFQLFNADNSVGAIIITGNEKVFSAGADLKEMHGTTYAQCISRNFHSCWDIIEDCRKPVIAAVNGYALGGGCEIALKCDIIYAGENAKFALPEVSIGTVTGAGGTQYLTRSVGKSKTMEIILTGNKFSAHEAERMGLVSKVFPVDKLMEESVKLGEKIASNSHLINSIAKESVNYAFKTTLKEGLHFEKRMFHSTFATKDQKEGMAAFIQKRPPNFVNE